MIFFLFFNSYAQASDQEFAEALKKEFKFETERRNQFKSHHLNSKIYNRERDKGLALYLEEQERWDILREKEAKVHARQRAKVVDMDENSFEYKKDDKLKKERQTEMEVARKKHIVTKLAVTNQFNKQINTSEEEELDLYSSRPRYELRKRHQNKWVSNGKSGGSSGGGSSGGGGGGGGSFDFPAAQPSQDYIPIDNFDEIPPPPLAPFDGGNQGFPGEPSFNEGFDQGFPQPGGDFPSYPPPPPPDGWDF